MFISYCLLWRLTRAYSPYDLHYASGIAAYQAEEWEKVVEELEKAIDEREKWIEWRIYCSIDACSKIPPEAHKGYSLFSRIFIL